MSVMTLLAFLVVPISYIFQSQRQTRDVTIGVEGYHGNG